jgi:hypothetical protein
VLCQEVDNKVEVATGSELSQAMRTQQACAELRNLWRYHDYTAFPISFCNELAKLSILWCRERKAWNRSAVSGSGSDPS